MPTWEILCSEKTPTYRLLSDVMKFLWLLNSTVNEVDIMVHFTFIFNIYWFQCCGFLLCIMELITLPGLKLFAGPWKLRRRDANSRLCLKGQTAQRGSPSLERLQAGFLSDKPSEQDWVEGAAVCRVNGPPLDVFPNWTWLQRIQPWEIPWWTSVLDPGLSLSELRFNPWSGN